MLVWCATCGRGSESFAVSPAIIVLRVQILWRAIVQVATLSRANSAAINNLRVCLALALPAKSVPSKTARREQSSCATLSRPREEARDRQTRAAACRGCFARRVCFVESRQFKGRARIKADCTKTDNLISTRHSHFGRRTHATCKMQPRLRASALIN